MLACLTYAPTNVRFVTFDTGLDCRDEMRVRCHDDALEIEEYEGAISVVLGFQMKKIHFLVGWFFKVADVADLCVGAE